MCFVFFVFFGGGFFFYSPLFSLKPKDSLFKSIIIDQRLYLLCLSRGLETLQVPCSLIAVRDWSLITGRGRATKREGGGGGRLGGECEGLPLQKKGGGGGEEKVLAMLKREGAQHVLR